MVSWNDFGLKFVKLFLHVELEKGFPGQLTGVNAKFSKIDIIDVGDKKGPRM